MTLHNINLFAAQRQPGQPGKYGNTMMSDAMTGEKKPTTYL
jgi:hypothetical protein